MPTYVYQREDGTTFELEQRITADPLTHCPTTGQKVKRVISGGTGLIFKGSGFYLTDYARSNGSSAAASGTDRQASDSTTDSSAAPSSESTSKADSKKDTKNSE